MFTAGNYINYTYDNIGQLQTARGYEPDAYDYDHGVSVPAAPRLHEQWGYAYDAAWNLARRTNNALVQSFGVNTVNELTTATRRGTLTVAGNVSAPPNAPPFYYHYPGVTNVTVSGTGLSSGNADLYFDGSWARPNATPANGANTYTAIAADDYGRCATNTLTAYLPTPVAYVYDLNGNLLGDGTRSFAYDDENQLVSVWQTNVWREDYVYDGLLRRRITRQYVWHSGWVQTNEIRYIYDKNLVIQERDGNNLPQVTYTRGNDLSGTLQGAGGIGGLLARTDNSQLMVSSPWASASYCYDGNGNVMGLVYTNGTLAAEYNYDPFGNLQLMSGPLAQANKIRFSSKEWDDLAGLYYYLYRFYDPNLQRWVNHDPIQEWGGINLYGFVGNNPINGIDPYGLDNYYGGVAGGSWNNNIPNMTISVPVGGGPANVQYNGGGLGDPMVLIGGMFGGGMLAAGSVGGVVEVCPVVVNNLHFDGTKWNSKDPTTGRIGQIRWGNIPLIRLDYHRLEPGGEPILHLNIGPGGIHIPIWGGNGPSIWQ